MRMIDFFDQYVKIGYKPVPLYRDSKVPVERDWNHNWSINRWRKYFEQGTYNLGFLLGDIVDIEGDTEESNEFLTNLIGNVPHPTFRSHKSIHHLFINPDKDLTRLSREGIEFRGYGHQSVVPPSSHKLGENYKWLKNTSPIPPEMPDNVLKFYKNFKDKFYVKPELQKKKKTCKPGNTRTKCRLCEKCFYVNKKRLILEVRAFREIGCLWMCRGCRTHDIRELCRFIRNEDH